MTLRIPHRAVLASVAALVALTAAPVAAQAAFPGANGRIAFSASHRIGSSSECGSTEVYSVNTRGAGLRRLTELGCSAEGGWAFGPDFSPDGRRILYTRLTPGTGVATMAPDGSDAQRLAAPYGVTPSLAPDGRQFAYVRFADEFAGGEIYRARTNRAGVRLLRAGERPAWSPRGRVIAYEAPKDGGISLMRTTDGAYVRRLGPARSRQPDFSPDGRRVVHQRVDSRGRSDLYVVRTDGSGARRLTATRTADESSPTWSPDGRRIAYIRGGSLWIMRAGGGSPRRVRARGSGGVLPSGPFGVDMTWQPLPR